MHNEGPLGRTRFVGLTNLLREGLGVDLHGVVQVLFWVGSGWVGLVFVFGLDWFGLVHARARLLRTFSKMLINLLGLLRIELSGACASGSKKDWTCGFGFGGWVGQPMRVKCPSINQPTNRQIIPFLSIRRSRTFFQSLASMAFLKSPAKKSRASGMLVM